MHHVANAANEISYRVSHTFTDLFESFTNRLKYGSYWRQYGFQYGSHVPGETAAVIGPGKVAVISECWCRKEAKRKDRQSDVMFLHDTPHTVFKIY
jgi:hypothetical protein